MRRSCTASTFASTALTTNYWSRRAGSWLGGLSARRSEVCLFSSWGMPSGATKVSSAHRAEPGLLPSQVAQHDARMHLIDWVADLEVCRIRLMRDAGFRVEFRKMRV